MQFDILSIFPHIFDSYFNESIIGRAQKRGLIKIKTIDIRDFALDKHKTVDDKPYGGGPGMIMKIEPIYRALKSLKLAQDKKTKRNEKIILLSPKGKVFNQDMAQQLSKYGRIVLICGRYEGIDERARRFVDEELSVGNYVLTGGELGAMIMVDAITRLAPGVIKPESLLEETFGKLVSKKSESEILNLGFAGEYPQYTRPPMFEYKDTKTGKLKRLWVPKVLLSGDHKKIREWRKKKTKRI